MNHPKIKLLLTSFAAIPYPWHMMFDYMAMKIPLLTTFSNIRFGSIGKYDKDFLQPGIYDGVESFFVDIIKRNGAINESRLKLRRKANCPHEAFHGIFDNEVFRRTKRHIEFSEYSKDQLRNLESHVKLTELLGLKGKTKVLNFHAGTYQKGNLDAKKNMMKNLDFLSSLIRGKDIIITFEMGDIRATNFEKNLVVDYDFYKDPLLSFNHPQLKFCYDFEHMNVYAVSFAKKENRTNQEQFLKNFDFHKKVLDEIGAHIAYAHIQYNEAHWNKAVMEEDKAYLHFDAYPLTRVPSWDENYWRFLKTLVFDTKISDFGLVNLEIFPKKLFGFLPTIKEWASKEEIIESARLFREKVLS